MKNYNAQEAANEAIQRGVDHTDAEWKSRAVAAIEQVCLSMPEFTADDVRDALGSDFKGTHDTRALGGLMRAAKRDKLCDTTGSYRPSKYTHAHVHQVWKSLIYKS